MRYKFTTIGYADISTEHITEKDSELMEAEGCPFRLAEEITSDHNCEGAFFYVPTELTDLKKLQAFGFSDDFVHLFE